MDAAFPSPPTANAAQSVWTQQQLDAYLDRPFQEQGRIFPGTEGMMLRDIEQDVLKGGRFIVHHWCLSIGIMSFFHTSTVYYLQSRKSGLGRACFYSGLSMVLGWWGIPFGFIYTPMTLWKNGKGGTDVTAEFLHQILGPERARSVLIKAAPRRISVLHRFFFSLSLLLPASLLYALIRS